MANGTTALLRYQELVRRLEEKSVKLPKRKKGSRTFEKLAALAKKHKVSVPRKDWDGDSTPAPAPKRRRRRRSPSSSPSSTPRIRVHSLFGSNIQGLAPRPMMDRDGRALGGGAVGSFAPIMRTSAISFLPSPTTVQELAEALGTPKPPAGNGAQSPGREPVKTLVEPIEFKATRAGRMWIDASGRPIQGRELFEYRDSSGCMYKEDGQVECPDGVEPTGTDEQLIAVDLPGDLTFVGDTMANGNGLPPGAPALPGEFLPSGPVADPAFFGEPGFGIPGFADPRAGVDTILGFLRDNPTMIAAVAQWIARQTGRGGGASRNGSTGRSGADCSYLARQLPKAAKEALAMWNCGLSQPIGASREAEMYWLAIMLSHSDFDIDYAGDCGCR